MEGIVRVCEATALSFLVEGLAYSYNLRGVLSYYIFALIPTTSRSATVICDNVHA